MLTASCLMRCVIVQSLTKSLSTAKNWMWQKKCHVLSWVLVAPQSGWKSIASQTSLSRGGGVEAKIWEKPTCQDGRAKIWSFGPSKPYTEERPTDKRRRHNMAVTVSANHPWRHNEEFCIENGCFGPHSCYQRAFRCMEYRPRFPHCNWIVILIWQTRFTEIAVSRKL